MVAWRGMQLRVGSSDMLGIIVQHIGKNDATSAVVNCGVPFEKNVGTENPDNFLYFCGFQTSINMRKIKRM